LKLHSSVHNIDLMPLHSERCDLTAQVHLSIAHFEAFKQCFLSAQRFAAMRLVHDVLHYFRQCLAVPHPDALFRCAIIEQLVELKLFLTSTLSW